MTAVLDASAVLALLFGEPGAETVVEHITDGAVMSTVNLAEVATANDGPAGWDTTERSCAGPARQARVRAHVWCSPHGSCNARPIVIKGGPSHRAQHRTVAAPTVSG